MKPIAFTLLLALTLGASMNPYDYVSKPKTKGPVLMSPKAAEQQTVPMAIIVPPKLRRLAWNYPAETLPLVYFQVQKSTVLPPVWTVVECVTNSTMSSYFGLTNKFALFRVGAFWK